jgi:hypothetical protein
MEATFKAQQNIASGHVRLLTHLTATGMLLADSALGFDVSKVLEA